MIRVIASLVAVGGLFFPSMAYAELEVGDKAPAFTMKGSDGKTYSLSDFKGEKAVVLAWFPRAFTGGCTKQCTSMATQGAALKEMNVAYFTASTDPVERNTDFAKSVGADYPILSDPDGEAAEKYGVLNRQRNAASRVTFYIDSEGIIREIDTQIETENAGKEVAETLEELGIAEK